MKKTLLLIALCFVLSSAIGQFYERQVGMRLGLTSGITGKIIKNQKIALEGMLGFRKGGLQMYGLVESYKSLLEDHNQDLRMFFGGGGHVGWINGTYKNHSNDDYEEEHIVGAVFGLDGIFGVEYQFRSAPVVIGAEFKPYVELIGLQSVKVNFWDFGLSVKYRFSEHK